MTVYRPGSFFLVTVPGPAGVAIRFGELLAGRPSRYCHAGMILGGDGTIIEAEPGGARVANLSEYAGHDILISDAPVQMWTKHGSSHDTADPPLAQWERELLDIRQTVIDEANKLVGVPYSALDYLALAALHLHLPSKWIRDRVRTSGHMICSQLVDAVYLNAGIHLFDDGRLPGDVMPSDLDKWIKDQK